MSRNARSRMGRAIKAAPSFSLDFTRGVLDPRLTFTRASGATYIDSTGIMQTAASNAPRFDYDPITLTLRGLLIEEARTNINPTSASWVTGGNATATQNAAGVDGTANAAFTLTEGGATATQQVNASTTSFATATAYTVAVLVKPGTATRCQLTVAGATFSGGTYANFGLTGAGSVLASGGTITSSGIRPYGNGFYLVWLVATSTAAASATAAALAFINSDTATRLPSYAGAGLTLIAHHCQVEAGAFPTSIIPTSGAAATRVTESAFVINRPWPWFNPSQGSVVIDWLLGPDGADLRPAAFDDGSNTNRIVFQRSTGNIWTGFGSGFGAGWSLVNVGGGVSGQGARCVIAGTYDTVSVSSSAKNGVVASAAAARMASPATSAVRFSVGNNNGGSQINGHLRAVDYYPVALDPQTLRRITSATENPSPRRINPDFSLHFLDGVLDSRVTFTRASSGTRINAAGVLVTETTNAPRFDYDPVTLARKGLLIEEARTNLVAVSRSAWGTAGAATGAYSALGSDGVASAAYLVAENTASSQQVSVAPTVSFTSGTTYTLSALVKPVGTSRVQLSGAGGVFGTAQYANFSLTGAGSVLASAGLTSSGIRPSGNGFYHCWITLAATSTATDNGVLATFINSDTATRSPVYVGSAANTLVLDHCQVEAGAFPTSIIPTSGAAATRAGEVATISGATFTALGYNQNEGTIVQESIRSNITQTARVIQFDDSGANRVSILLAPSAGVQHTILNASPFYDNTGGASWPVNVPWRSVLSYRPGYYQSASGGTAFGSASNNNTPPTGINRVSLGCTATGASVLNGHIRHIDYYRQALPADFITELSR